MIAKESTIQDKAIQSLLEREVQRQTEGVELIASENYASNDTIAAMGTIFTNKYAEGYPGKRYYGGCEVVDELERLAIERLKELFGAEYANVQPHSGSQANAAVFLALLKPGDSILGFDLSHGGHLTHGSPVNFSGKNFKPFFYGINRETGRIDYNQLEEVASKEKPKLIICGASAYSRDIDYKKIREVADSIGAMLLADIAHPAGLIAKGELSDPLPHCHIVTSTTHKTLRGPRGGIIMMGQDFENPFDLKTPKGATRMMSSLLDSGVFPGTQGGPLEHVIAAKAVAFGEALTDGFGDYIRQVVANAKVLAQELVRKDYHIISGGTDNHCILIDLRNKDVSGKEAEAILLKGDMTTNKNMVPFDTRSPFVTSGIRIGTAAVTTRGLKEDDMVEIAEFIDEAIKSRENEKALADLKGRVNEKMSAYPLFQWS